MTWQSPISPGISWYEASLGDRPSFPVLEEDISADVVIVGGGFCGLSAAYHLAKGGVDVALVEAHKPGDGASGRNGGQMGSGQRGDIDNIEKEYGFERSKALWDLAEEAKQNLHQVARDNDFAFDYREGQLTPMHKARFERHAEAHVEALRSRYGYDHISYLPRADMAERLGSARYFGGTRDTGTGHIHPLKYLAGLAGAARKAGARIFEQTPASGIGRGEKIRIRTPAGSISADRCLLALNAHHDGLEPTVARHVAPIRSFIGATEPLPADSPVIPGGEAVDDSRFVVRYFRKSADNRLLFGGREAYTAAHPVDISVHIRRQIAEIYPALSTVPITHAWGGSVGITMPRLPFVREVQPGVLTAGGFSGHGVIMSNYTGRLAAEHFLGQNDRLRLLKELNIAPFPGGAMLQKPLLLLALTWYSIIDRI